jgi:two-component system chemotaxis response regulator CheY
MDSLRALVIDDSQTMRRSLTHALGNIGGMTCIEAADGVDGIRKFEQDRFDVIVTDINMPVMDGLKLVSHIRKGVGNKDVPIVIVTARSSEADRKRAMALGASAYLVKPVNEGEVLHTVKGLLNLE